MNKNMTGNKKLTKTLSLHDQVVALILRDGRSYQEISDDLGGRPTRWTLWNWCTNYEGRRYRNKNPVNGQSPLLEKVARHYGYNLQLKKERL